MKGAVAVALSLLCAVHVVAAGNDEREAAVRAQASVDGIEEVLHAIAPALLDSIVETDLEDIEGQTDIALVGLIDFELTKLNVETASFESLSVEVPAKIEFGLEGIQLRVTADWAFRKTNFPWIPFGSGGMVADVSRSDIFIGVSTGVNELGQPTAVIDDVEITLRDVDISTSGSWFSWLYNFLIWLFNGAVKNALTEAINETMSETLNDYIEEILASIPTTFPISDNLELDYALTEAPLYTCNPDSVVISLLGEFFDPVTQLPAPFKPVFFNAHQAIPGDVRLWIDQFLLNSFLFTAYETDLINVVLRDGDPVDIDFGFNTNDWLLVIPRLPLFYPNRELELVVTAADEQPLVEITDDLLGASADIFITFMAEGSGDAENPVFEEAFKLRAKASTGLEAGIDSTPDDTRLTFKLTHIDFDLTVESSNIGSFEVRVLNEFIGAIFDEVLLPLINDILQEGFELPQMDGVAFDNPSIAFVESAIAIDTEITYQVPDDMLARIKRKQELRRLAKQQQV